MEDTAQYQPNLECQCTIVGRDSCQSQLGQMVVGAWGPSGVCVVVHRVCLKREFGKRRDEDDDLPSLPWDTQQGVDWSKGMEQAGNLLRYQ